MEINIIAGFTGSGKTTYIKKTERFSNKTIIIVNEKGCEQYNYDGDSPKIYYLPQGCICCTLTLEFKAVLEKIQKDLPETLFLELAGTCMVKDVIKIMATMDFFKNSNLRIITTVSAEECLYFLKYMGEFYIEQIQAADEILISNCAECSREEIDEIINRLNELNCGASIICN